MYTSRIVYLPMDSQEIDLTFDFRNPPSYLLFPESEEADNTVAPVSQRDVYRAPDVQSIYPPLPSLRRPNLFNFRAASATLNLWTGSWCVSWCSILRFFSRTFSPLFFSKRKHSESLIWQEKSLMFILVFQTRHLTWNFWSWMSRFNMQVLG